jgi:hypothetical protein
MRHIVVAEDEALRAGAADAFDHGIMIERVGLNWPTMSKAHSFSRPSGELEMRCFDTERECDRSACAL